MLCCKVGGGFFDTLQASKIVGRATSSHQKNVLLSLLSLNFSLKKLQHRASALGFLEQAADTPV